VRVSAREESLGEHLRAVVPRLHVPLAGRLGTHARLRADHPEAPVVIPSWLAAAVVLASGVALVFAAREARGSPASQLLFLCAALAVLAFPFPLRSGPSALRLLTLSS